MYLKDLKTQLFIILFLGLSSRLFAWILYYPVTYPDSDWYISGAENISKLTWTWVNGARAPGYSTFILLCGFELLNVYTAQLIIGIINAFLLFVLFREISPNTNFGLIAGLISLFNPNQFLFEALILSETVATFLLFLTLVLIVKCRLRMLSIVIISVTTALLILTRPLFLYLPILFVAIYLNQNNTYQHNWIKAKLVLAYVFCLALCIGPIIYLNKAHNGFPGITSLLGFNLINHATEYIESAPAEYEKQKQLIINQRDMQTRMGLKPSFAIYHVYNDSLFDVNKNINAASKMLLRMAMKTILNDPYGYLRVSLNGLIDFWKPSFQYHGFHWHKYSKYILYIISFCMFLSYVGLFFGPIASVLFQSGGSSTFYNKQIIFLYSVVMSGWIVTSLIDYGENARYKSPFDSIALVLGIMAIYNYLMIKRQHHKVQNNRKSISRYIEMEGE